MRIAFAAVIAGLWGFVPCAAATDREAQTWDLADLYPSDEAWQSEFARLTDTVAGLERYRGTLGKSAEDMLAALSAISTTRRQVDRLQLYAALKNDENTANQINRDRRNRAFQLSLGLTEKTAWLNPEILGLGDKATAFTAQSADLKARFGFLIGNVLRGRTHTLNADSERLLARQQSDAAAVYDAYETLKAERIVYPALTLHDGTRIARLDPAQYANWRQASDRSDRKAIFDAYWAAWKAQEDGLGATLSKQVRIDVENARARHFANSLSDALFSDAITDTVYRQLVAQTKAGLPVFQRYLKLRQKILGIAGNPAIYDLFAPNPANTFKPSFSLEDSERIALAATAAYGPEFTGALRRGFAGRWMDGLPRTAKAPTDYVATGAYDVHPYLLFHRNDSFYSLSAFLHQWTQAVHAVLTRQAQPFEKASFSALAAETSANTSDLILIDYLVAHARTKEEKRFYLYQGLEQLRSTFFRQAMYAEFQLAIHEEAESGHELSGKAFSKLYSDLTKRYYGGEMDPADPAYCLEWAAVPHFYYGFYAYQYPVALAAAASLAEAFAQNPAQARERYVGMLKAGASDYPVNVIKAAGVDLEQPEPYLALFSRMNRMMDEIEKLH